MQSKTLEGREELIKAVLALKLMDDMNNLIAIKEMCEQVIRCVETFERMWTMDGIPDDADQVLLNYVLYVANPVIAHVPTGVIYGDKAAMYRTVTCAKLLKEGIEKKIVEVATEAVKND